RTATPMCVLEVKSRARNPTRSMTGAICRMCAVVRPVALHRLWLPSRSETSTSWTSATAPPGAGPPAVPGALPRAAEEPGQVAGVHAAARELGLRGQRGLHADGRRHPGDLAAGQRAAQ